MTEGANRTALPAVGKGCLSLGIAVLAGGLLATGILTPARATDKMTVTGVSSDSVRLMDRKGTTVQEVSRDQIEGVVALPYEVAADDIVGGQLVPMSYGGKQLYAHKLMLKLKIGGCPNGVNTASDAVANLSTSGSGAQACK